MLLMLYLGDLRMKFQFLQRQIFYYDELPN